MPESNEARIKREAAEKEAADKAAADKAAAEGQKDSKPAKPRLVKMRRSHPQHPGGPTTADVHPDEVSNYAAGGWLIEQDELK